MVLIQALFCNCDIYIFDEPFDGLDEKTRKIFVSQLIKIKKRYINISINFTIGILIHKDFVLIT